jgi:hypothetical protein
VSSTPIRPYGRSVVGTVTLVLLAVVLAAPAARAQEEPAARVTVTALSGVLGPGTVPPEPDPTTAEEPPTTLELRALVEPTGDVPLIGAQLVVEVHPPALTRGVLAAALDGNLTTVPVAVRNEPIRPDTGLGPRELAGFELALERDEVPWAEDVGGVHPVRVAVVRGTEVLAERITAVVWLNEPAESPLLTTLLWPIDAAPWRGVAGTYPVALERETQPGSRLDRLVGAAERAPSSVPLVLAPAAHLLEDLSDRSDGYVTRVRTPEGALESRTVAPGDPGAVSATALLRRIRDLAASQLPSPISATYADADLPALVAGDDVQREIAAVAASEGRRRVQRLLAVEVDGATHLVTDPIDLEVLDVLPGETLVLPASVTDLPELGADPDLGQPVRTLRAPSGRLLTVLVADPYLAVALSEAAAGDPVLAAQRVVAASAMAYLTAPGAQSRALVLLPERTWDPPGAVAEEILTALGAATWLRFVPPSRLATDALRTAGGLGLAPVEAGPFAPELTSELETAWTGLTAASDAAPEGTTRLDDRPVELLRDDLLRATSRWYREPREELAIALARDVRRAVDTAFGEVEVVAGSVTLTSDTGEIPITLQRTRGPAVRITVSIQSQGRLLWPEGRTSEVLTLEPDSSQTISFSTQALSTGTFPVTVVVTDPGGTRELARGTLSVRSTTISGPAMLGMGVLVVGLLLAGALRRKPPRPQLALVRDTTESDATGATP